MDRDQAERERDRLAAENPDTTFIVAPHERGFRVLRAGIQPADSPSGTSIAHQAKPERPDSPPAPDKQQYNPNWGW